MKMLLEISINRITRDSNSRPEKRNLGRSCRRVDLKSTPRPVTGDKRNVRIYEDQRAHVMNRQEKSTGFVQGPPQRETRRGPSRGPKAVGWRSLERWVRT